MRHHLHLDFETYSDLDIRDVGAYRYAEHPSTSILLTAYAIDDGPVYQWQPHLKSAPPSRLVNALEDDDVDIVAHNAEFERQIIIRCMGINPRRGRFRCTAVRAAAAGLPRGLDGALAGLGHPVRKDPRGKAALRRFCSKRKPSKKDDRTRILPAEDPERWQVLVEYNAQDVHAERALDKAIPDLAPREWRYYHYLCRVNDRGLPLDIETLAASAKVVAALELESKQRVQDLTGGINPTQVEKLRLWMNENGADLPNLQLKTLNLALREKLPPAVREIIGLRIESSRASTKKIKAMLDVVCTDGRAHGTLLPFGAHCVTGDVEALTSDGWVRLDEFKGGKIAQVYPDQTIDFIEAKPFKGPISNKWIDVNSAYVKGAFTHGHTVPYLMHGSHRWNTLDAFDLLERKATIIPISGALKSSGLITPDQMRVLVMVQADGSYETKIRNGRGLTVFVKKPRKIKRARRILAAAGVTFRENTFPSQPGYVRFSIRWADLPKWLTVERKLFGSWLLDSTPESREAFINELCHWDGYVHNRKGSTKRADGHKVYCSIVEENVNWVCTIAHLTGRAARPGFKAANTRGGYNRKKLFRAAIREHDYTKVHTGEQVTQTKQPARTYCVESKTGFWLARSRGRIFVTGNTGRLSGKLIQPHNFTRGLLDNSETKGAVQTQVLEMFRDHDAEVVNALLWHQPEDTISGAPPLQGPMSMLAQSMRGFIKAPDGYWFLIADYAAIEARILAWVANEVKLLIAYRNNVDTYKMMASVLYKVAVELVTKEQRRIGKNLRLGAGYQLGAEKLVEHCAAEEIIITLAFAKIAIKAFRDDNPNIVRMWYYMEEAAIRAVQQGSGQIQGTKEDKGVYFEKWRDWLLMGLPSGRRMHYYAPAVEQVVKFGKAKLQVSYYGQRKHVWGRTSTYGGKLVENMVQAIARDIMLEGMLAGEEAGYPALASIHDEVVTLRRIGKGSIKELEQAICRMPRWAATIPLGAEGFHCLRYRKN